MRDFTFASYKRYLLAIRSSYEHIMTFEEFFTADPKPSKYCLIRHDVDRRPKKSLLMARLENQLHIRSTFFFRAKKHVFKPDIIREISRFGHEIGYHYESLSDSKGDIVRALKDFEHQLARFRNLVPVKSIAMHGRPLQPFDNRDLWRDPERHRLLRKRYRILGEVYLDLNYSDVAYINDTGRNWSTVRSNLQDRVMSDITPEFVDGDTLHNYLNTNPCPRMIFQVHPERWSIHLADHAICYAFDAMANGLKYLILRIRGG